MNPKPPPLIDELDPFTRRHQRYRAEVRNRNESAVIAALTAFVVKATQTGHPDCYWARSSSKMDAGFQPTLDLSCLYATKASAKWVVVNMVEHKPVLMGRMRSVKRGSPFADWQRFEQVEVVEMTITEAAAREGGTE